MREKKYIIVLFFNQMPVIPKLCIAGREMIF